MGLFSLISYVVFILVLSYRPLNSPQNMLEEHSRQTAPYHLKATEIFAHIAGFTGIGTWGYCQTKFRVFNSYPVLCLLESAMAFCAMWVLLACSVPITDALFLKLHPMLRDFKEDRGMLQSKLFLVVLRDGEIFMMSLIVSFLFVNSLRFQVGGHLPNAIGEEESVVLLGHTWWQILSLYLCSLFFLAVPICNCQCKKNKSEGPEEPGFKEVASDEEDSDIDYEMKRWEICRKIKDNVSDRPRLGIVLHNILMMSFAWTFYCATQWLVVRMGSNNKHLVNGHLSVDETLLDLIVAVLVSILGGLGAWYIYREADKVHHVSTDEEDETTIPAVLRAIALLVGFAWEQSFDITVDVICERIYDGWGKFVVITFVVGMIALAWSNYIIPMRGEQWYRFSLSSHIQMARALPGELRSKLEVGGSPFFVL